MTISSITRKAGPFSGNNVTVAFPFAFKVFEEGDLVVVATDADDIETTKTLTTHYTVSLNADQNASPGGTVTMLSAPASGTLLTITSNVPELQAVALTNNGGFYPDVINGALDRLTILIQQVAEETDRAVKVPISSSTDPDNLVASVTASEVSAAASAAAAASSAAAAAAAVPSGSLGYTPVNIVGDTMTGELALPSIKLGASASYTSFGNAVTKNYGSASGDVPEVGTVSATETIAGLSRRGTTAEALAGTDDAAYMTALKTKQAQKILQVVHLDAGALATGTTIIPFDDTIPAQTEGDQYMSLAITPLSATSTLVIDIVYEASVNTAAYITSALFRDADAGSIGTMVNYTASSGHLKSCAYSVKAASGATTPTTFKLRIGPSVAATITFNGTGSAARFGGTMASSMRITEIAA